MNNREAYNKWSETYDSIVNKTRDIEAVALRSILSKFNFDSVLEIGCGTGKNTSWIAFKSKHVIAIDFSSEMISKAIKKIKEDNVLFQQADITQPWKFAAQKFDLVICSLVLEHIKNIHFVFEQANLVLKSGGYFYIGELHPFKQYAGSKARFDNGDGMFELECFIHNISDYFNAATANNFESMNIDEWFDDNDNYSIPRLLSMVFKRKN
jgi:ubiquinone/menaquinone biosynthesis C-methylase UbiE